MGGELSRLRCPWGKDIHNLQIRRHPQQMEHPGTEGQNWFLYLNLGPGHCENWLGEVPHLAPKGAFMQMWG